MFSSTSMDERISIRDSAKSLKKYGSTSNNGFRKPETFVKHMISSSDTLQGIALKYGVTTEQIRRTNRLWANDSLFLRESLLIPVPLDRDSLMTSPTDVSLFDISECSQFVNSTTDDISAADGVTAGSSTNPSRSGSFRSDSGTSGISSTYNGDVKGGGGRSLSNGDIKSGAASNGHYDPDAYTEFLVRIDCDIASTRSQVIQAQGKSEFRPQDDDCIFLSKRKPQSRRKQAEAQATALTELPSVVTQGSRVRTSLQKMQEKHDELFELCISSTYNGDMKGGGRSLSNGDIKSGAAGASSNGHYDPDAYTEFLVRIDCDIASTRSQVISSNGHYDPDAYTEFLVRFPYANSLYLLIPGISSTYNGDMKGGGRSLSNGDIKSGAAGASSNGHYDPDAYTEFLVRIDCDIASTRSQVIQAQGKSEFRPQDDDCIFLSKRKPQSRRKQAEAQATALTELPSVVTQGSRVRTSLQKMQEKHDELFEL
ncbi:uncharacterized protein LOC103514179 [Diaphorina citri]|uniref:Uncharacterized protein LOC103514179 n=1 Tax=Diaphorina citri TaxID=121845 RepID=A0A3Q0J3G0_DIACI|nr:uncharacterized protein LOC103514179 [Diaphorina citri]